MDLSDLSFLVVDDESLILDIIASILKNVNAKNVYKSDSAKYALDILSDTNRKIDCIISDHGIEPVTGLELLQGIREGRNPDLVRDTRFIMLTSHSEKEVVQTALALDVDGYVIKPISPGGLVQTIERAFARKRILKAGSDYAAVELAKAG